MKDLEPSLPQWLAERGLGAELFQKALEQSPAAIALTDTSGHWVYVNRRFLHLTGYTRSEVLGQHTRLLKSGEMNPADYVDLWDTIRRGEEWSGVFHNRRKDGRLYWERATISPIRNNQGHIEYFIKIGEDITWRKAAEGKLARSYEAMKAQRDRLNDSLEGLRKSERDRDRLLRRLRRLVRSDPLTGLLNRRGFDEALRRIWNLGERHPFPVGLLVVDIDHFKTLNDRYGHQVGDLVLQECARRLRATVRDADLICRYGGDEFVVILPWSDSAETIRAAERILGAFRERLFAQPAHEIKVTVSVGACAAQQGDDLTLDRLLVRTDQALYQAKRSGRDRICSWDQVNPTERDAGAEGPGRYGGDVLPQGQAMVLLVDDDPALIRLLTTWLGHAGYAVRSAQSRAEALAVLERERGRIDIALLDLELGSESGMQLLEEIRNRDDGIVNIIITGHATVDRAVDALRLGAYDLLGKPVTRAQLEAVLEKAVTYRRLTLENRRYQKHLSDMVREKSVALSSALEKSRSSYRFTLETMAAVLDAREHETGEHSIRVARLARILARAMGVPPDEVECIETGALLHDIGKIAIPDAILLKPAPLTPGQQEVMRQHPQRGFDMIRSNPMLAEASKIVLQHQEHFDGNGYPQGLRGEDICLGARIFAVVDAYDAMRSERPYSRARSPQPVLREILHHQGTQFDPAVVAALQHCQADIERSGQWPQTARKTCAD